MAPKVWIEEDAEGLLDEEGEYNPRHAGWSILIDGKKLSITRKGFALKVRLTDDDRAWWMIKLVVVLQ